MPSNGSFEDSDCFVHVKRIELVITHVRTPVLCVDTTASVRVFVSYVRVSTVLDRVVVVFRVILVLVKKELCLGLLGFLFLGLKFLRLKFESVAQELLLTRVRKEGLGLFNLTILKKYYELKVLIGLCM
eukprot:TRINITY_DN2944_c0_g1_i4.p2 TRINITY_DN2944_c0_g1~~TRINITY_DN2944_c0_g1_i4.p2  ORF type:complete len:129 (-),score=11.09 TRINITY_DN2944_c0_g1_i4:660-1046(-)